MPAADSVTRMRFLIALLAGLFLLTACSSEDPGPATSRTTDSVAPSPSAKSTGVTPGGLAVVGVRFDDKLNVRRTPSATAAVLGRLAPLTSGVQATGQRSGAWVQVRVPAGKGWVHGRYLGTLAEPVDVTSEARGVGIAPTRKALLRQVATQQAESGDGTLVGPVLVARKGNTLTGDVLGYADDAIAGERFKIVVVPGEAGFEVTSATATAICARGVDSAGMCS